MAKKQENSISMLEVRIPEDSDFDKLRHMCDDSKEWDMVYQKKTVRVWTRPAEESDFKMIKVRTEYSDLPASTVYDVLHDSEYRSEWDKYMMDCKDIGLVNPNNDVCYYAVRSPPPLRHRDFVLQRSWLDTGQELMIFNHSVCHDDFPPRKGCVRAMSFFTGYLVRSLGTRCCQLTYISHSDPKGHLPSWVVNKLTQIVTPKMVKKLHKACTLYPSWKAKHDPDWKPWSHPHQLAESKRVDLSRCKPKDYVEEFIPDESELGEVDVGGEDELMVNGNANGSRSASPAVRKK